MRLARREFLKAMSLLGPAAMVLGGAERAMACDVAGRMPADAAKPVLPAPRYVTTVMRRFTPSGIGYNDVVSLPE